MKTARDWWRAVDEQWDNLKAIMFHDNHLAYDEPAYEEPGEDESKPTGRKLLEEVEHLRKKRDRRLRAYLGIAWALASDAYARSVMGWGTFCDLLSEDHVLQIDFDLYVQLHEHVEIKYFVDHYAAEFWVGDWGRCVAVGKGDTIEEALDALLTTLGVQELSEWRKSPEVQPA